MEHPADVTLELVKFVDWLGRPYVPQHTVIQDELVGGVKGRAVFGVMVAEFVIFQLQD